MIVMFTTRNARQSPRRRGMILMVVLALLTLFAIVGITFVYVASAQETSARMAREAETTFKPALNPEAAFELALSQLLYDANHRDEEVTDTGGKKYFIPSGIYSSLRGHSLARNMYGWNHQVLNDKPYSGVGRVAFQHTSFDGVNDIKLVNYNYFNEFQIRDPERVPLPDPNSPRPHNLFYRGSVNADFDPVRQAYVPMGGVPYTYPDHNNLFLAQIDPVSGKIVAPSFHREYLFGRLDLPKDRPGPPNNVAFQHYNPNWEEERKGKYYTLRPTPGFHKFQDSAGNLQYRFPMPVDANGDVKNLDGSPGGMDSIWIDIGAPVMTAPQFKATDGSGKPLRYKMLVAPLILDLDGRIDLNVVGNLMGNRSPNQEHRSNQGWGAWEINPQKVLNRPGALYANEWRNLFFGTQETANRTRYLGRYDTNNQPNPNPPLWDGPNPNKWDEHNQPRWRVPLGPHLNGAEGRVRGWAQVDFNGAEEDTDGSGPTRAVSQFYLPPSAAPQPGLTIGGQPYYGGFSAFPFYNVRLNKDISAMPATWQVVNTNTYGNGSTIENWNHAALYWPMRPRSAPPASQLPPNYRADTGSNRRFPIKDLVRLLREGGSSADQSDSDLRALLKGNLWNTDPLEYERPRRRRNLVTLLSADLDRPGATPYLWDPYANNTTPGRADSDTTRLGLRPNGVRWSLGAAIPDIPFPYLIERNPTAPALESMRVRDASPPANARALQGPAQGDFDVDTWRGRQTGLTQQTTPSSYTENPLEPGRLQLRQRLNLIRPLSAYPTPDASTGAVNILGDMTVQQQHQKAVEDRQRFAADLFTALRHAAGMDAGEANNVAQRVYDTFGGTADSPEYRALRALAQIAVNIVDYLDDDDYMTTFKWAEFTPMAGPPARTEYVIGFELPRLVINESYVQYENKVGTIDTTNNRVDPGNAKYNVNVWAELMNPLVDDSAVHDPNNSLNGFKDTTARLEVLNAMGGRVSPVYRLMLCDGDLSSTANSPFRDPANVTGHPGTGQYHLGNAPGGFDNSRVRAVVGDSRPGDPMATVNPWGTDGTLTHKQVEPAPLTSRFQDATADRNKGFYVVGPNVTHLDTPPGEPPANPSLPTTITSPGMSFEVDALADDTADRNAARSSTNLPKPYVVLQRLANPAIPAQEDPTQPRYNPWVTVDYVDHNDAVNMVNDVRHYDKTGIRDMGNMLGPKKVFRRTSVIRRQPYAAAQRAKYEVLDPNVDPMPEPTEPQHTFFRQNSRATTAVQLADAKNTADGGTEDMLKLPFDWLAHIDRKPISPAELWHVTGLPPHLVTQDFVQGTNLADAPQGHTVPWGNSATRLYRFFEFVSVPPRATGNIPTPQDRVMGKVNINTVWNRDVFRALADAQKANSFYDLQPPAGDATEQSYGPDNHVDKRFAALMRSRSPKAYVHGDSGQPRLANPSIDPNDTVNMPPSWRLYPGDYVPVLRPTDTNLVTAITNDPVHAPLATAMGLTTSEGDMDRPFWSFAMGNQVTGDLAKGAFAGRAYSTTGINDTLFRNEAGGGTTPVFDVPPSADASAPKFHQYQKKELLTKLFSNLTTRSNVYAVWLTVGFFEVHSEGLDGTEDRNGNGVLDTNILGREIGRDENRHVRYRMFAIVDRTQMAAFSTTCSAFNEGGLINDLQTPPSTPRTWQVGDPVRLELNWDGGTSDKVTDGRTGRVWTVTDGTVLTFEPNTDNEESVVVFTHTRPAPLTGTYLAARFQKRHPAGCRVICRGNPGPMSRYNPRDDGEVVPFFMLID
jgi:hypothetical protein